VVFHDNRDTHVEKATGNRNSLNRYGFFRLDPPGRAAGRAGSWGLTKSEMIARLDPRRRRSGCTGRCTSWQGRRCTGGHGPSRSDLGKEVRKQQQGAGDHTEHGNCRCIFHYESVNRAQSCQQQPQHDQNAHSRRRTTLSPPHPSTSSPIFANRAGLSPRKRQAPVFDPTRPIARMLHPNVPRGVTASKHNHRKVKCRAPEFIFYSRNKSYLIAFIDLLELQALRTAGFKAAAISANHSPEIPPSANDAKDSAVG
jgi:hypothetical protein